MIENMPKSKYRVICLETISGDSYLIVRDMGSDNAVVLRNGIETEHVRPLGETNRGSAKYVELTDMDPDIVGPNVDPEYKGCLSEDNRDCAIIVCEDDRCVNLDIERMFAYDVESGSCSAVIDDALVRHVRPYVNRQLEEARRSPKPRRRSRSARKIQGARDITMDSGAIPIRKKEMSREDRLLHGYPVDDPVDDKSSSDSDIVHMGRAREERKRDPHAFYGKFKPTDQ